MSKGEVDKKHPMGSMTKGGGSKGEKSAGRNEHPVPKPNTGRKVQMDGTADHGGGMGEKDATRFERALGLKDPYGDAREKDLHAGRPKNDPQYNHE